MVSLSSEGLIQAPGQLQGSLPSEFECSKCVSGAGAINSRSPLHPVQDRWSPQTITRQKCLLKWGQIHVLHICTVITVISLNGTRNIMYNFIGYV